MIVRYVLKPRHGSEHVVTTEQVGSWRPVPGDTISIAPGEPGAGCYWVQRLEWQLVGGVMTEVKVIAAASNTSSK
ncbi:MAG: hypothetical protein H6734_14680 [Alphaproteobacteria bacterium]|nr:hypothetical protein [Alphaproteobacteria bacterium]